MTPAPMHVAQFNLARLKHPIDDPRSAEFRDNLDRVNAAGKRMPGFVWVLEDASGTATAFRIDDDPQMLVNLSVWESVAHLKAFVFGKVHGSFLARRELWFDAAQEAYAVMWQVSAGETPTLEEAMRRLRRLRAHGPSPAAFGWKEALGAEEVAALRAQ